jgi:hypothetical protein
VIQGGRIRRIRVGRECSAKNKDRTTMGERWQPRCGVEKGEEETLRTERGIGSSPRAADVGVEVIDWRWDGGSFWGFGEVFWDEWRKKVGVALIL